MVRFLSAKDDSSVLLAYTRGPDPVDQNSITVGRGIRVVDPFNFEHSYAFVVSCGRLGARLPKVKARVQALVQLLEVAMFALSFIQSYRRESGCPLPAQCRFIGPYNLKKARAPMPAATASEINR